MSPDRGPAGKRPSLRPPTGPDLRRRTLSQNFLRDGTAVRRYLAAVALDPDGLAVEIGAGQGALTRALAGRCRRLVAYEIDPTIARQLIERVADQPNVQVVVDDFRNAVPPREPFQAVGNVPFSLTSQAVDWCLAAGQLSSATLITQLEYARKRTGDYGRWSLLTVRTWPDYTWELRGTIPRTSFRPVPAVDAGILRVARRPRPLVTPGQAGQYAQLVEHGFRGIGGSLYASLVRRYPAGRVRAAFRAAQLDRATVVAFVHPDQWLRLFEALT